MLSDEQILAKTSKLLDILQEKCWDGYKQVGMKDKGGKKVPNCVPVSEKVLREVTEDEMRALEDVLEDLDPTKLPLNDLFDGKMRVVVPFPTMDTESELGQFVEELENVLELDIDWEKGIVSAQRQWTEASIENDVKLLNLALSGEAPKKVNRKFQIKIGKYFAKLDKLLRDYKEMRDIIAKKVYDGRHPGAWHASFSINQMKSAFTTDQLKRYYQIQNGLELYVGTDSISRLHKYYGSYEDIQAGKITKIPQLAKYWQENAGYIKQNIQNLTNDRYSIIITRHPIDVLRMSDFDNITSCHSPASRSGAYQSYYKCAVAEAQGHGAVAYVVETEDLLSATNTGNINSAEQEIQEGEIFYDDKRPSDTGDIRPVSRTRIRHMRYYDTEEPKRWDDGQDIGIPEKRVYGASIPGINDKIVDWARQNQEQAIKNMPKEDDKINLDRFMIFGGSYEDTQGPAGRKSLIQQLLGLDIELTGKVKQNTETEDSLDANLIGDIMRQYDQECELIAARWNSRYAATFVEYEVEDDGADGVYIQGLAKVIIEWELEDWNKLPNSWESAIEHSPDVINDIYGDLLAGTPEFFKTHDNTVKWVCNANLEHPDLGGTGYYSFPDQFEEMCASVDTIIDDKRDAFTEILTNYFAREGYMAGGQYIQLAVDIENGEVSSYEWDVETDGEYEDSYESYASYSYDYDPEDWQLNRKILEDILESRDFKIAIRKALLDPARDEVGTEYYLQMNTSVRDFAGDARVTVRFTVNRDEPDEMADLFRALVEGDMDDEDNLTAAFTNIMTQFINARQPSFMQTNESIVKTWKGFLKQ